MTVTEAIQKATLDTEVLDNIDLANEVAHTNLEQQNEIANNQALFQLKYATVAKCIEVIMSIDPDSKDAPDKIGTYKSLMDQFVDIFDKMEARKPTNKKESGSGLETAPTDSGSRSPHNKAPKVK